VIPHAHVIFTGPVDEYFDFRFGRLPYRSLDLSSNDEPADQPDCTGHQLPEREGLHTGDGVQVSDWPGASKTTVGL
jgi:hypothetical protein